MATMKDYEELLITRYLAGGIDRSTATHFAQGETHAIYTGNHWTAGKQTASEWDTLVTREALKIDPRTNEEGLSLSANPEKVVQSRPNTSAAPRNKDRGGIEALKEYAGRKAV
jgi:hypothetical protein